MKSYLLILTFILSTGQLFANEIRRVRPILINLGLLRLKSPGLPVDADRSVSAREFLQEQNYSEVEAAGKVYTLIKSSQGVQINTLKGCSDIFFNHDGITCHLPDGIQTQLDLNLRLKATPELRNYLGTPQTLCKKSEGLESFSDSELSVLEDLFYLRREIESLKSRGLDMSGLYLEEDLIEERERVLASLVKSWEKLDQEKYSNFERIKLSLEMRGVPLKANYLGCEIKFRFTTSGCELLGEDDTNFTGSENAQCDIVKLSGGALWCDGERRDFKDCLLGHIGSSASGFEEATQNINIYDGPRDEKPWPASPHVVPYESEGVKTKEK